MGKKNQDPELAEVSVPEVKRLLEVALPLPPRSPELRLDCPDYLKWDVVISVREVFARRYRVIDIDGARIYFGEGDWALIRASNTSPKLSLRFEGRSQESMERMKGDVRAELVRHLPDLPEF